MTERQTWRWRAARAMTSLGLGTALAGLLGLSGPASHPIALAQTPTAESCRIPTVADRAPLTDGTDALVELPGFPDGATPAATPVSDAIANDPAAATLDADLDLVVHALAACLSSGAYDTVTDLAGGRFLGTLAATGGTLDSETYLLLAQDLPVTPFTIYSVTQAQLQPNGQATADVVYSIANQLFHGRWTFVQSSDGSDVPAAGEGNIGWIVDNEVPLEVQTPETADDITVNLDEYRIGLKPTEMPAGIPLLLKIRNRGEDEHEVIVLRVNRGGDVDDLLLEPGPGLPDGLAFAGQVTVPAGARANLILVDLQPGTYALVSLLPTADGSSDLARGMQATLTVT